MRQNSSLNEDWYPICRKSINGTLEKKLTNVSIDTHVYLDANMTIRGRVFLGHSYGSTGVFYINPSSCILGIATSDEQFYNKNYTTYVFLGTNTLTSLTPLEIKPLVANQPFALEIYACGKSSSNTTTNAMFVGADVSGYNQNFGYQQYYNSNVQLNGEFIGKYYFDGSKTIKLGINSTAKSQQDVYYKINYCIDDGTLEDFFDIKIKTIDSADSMILYFNTDKNNNNGLSIYNLVTNSGSNRIKMCIEYNNDYVAPYTTFAEVDINKIQDYNNKGIIDKVYIDDDISAFCYNYGAICRYDLYKVKLNKSLKKIQTRSFQHIHNLEEIDMTDSQLEEIEEGAFFYTNSTSKISKLDFPNTLRKIGREPFGYMGVLSTLIIPTKLSSLSAYFGLPSSAINLLNSKSDSTGRSRGFFLKLSQIYPLSEAGINSIKSEINSNTTALLTLYKYSGLAQSNPVINSVVYSGSFVVARLKNPNSTTYIFHETSGLKEIVCLISQTSITYTTVDFLG